MENEERTFEEIRDGVVELLEQRKFIKAREELLACNEADIAEILEEVLDKNGIDKLIIIFRMLPKDISVDVFSFLPTDDQLALIDGITDKEILYIVDEMDFDDMIDLMEELPANLVDKILEKTPKDERRLINTYLNYPDDCAGTLMTPDYITLQREMTVREAMEHIKREGLDSETVYTCYVKDKGRKLIGIVSLKNLVISDDNVKIEDIMHEDYISVNVYDDQEEVAEAFKKYDYLAIPVVDKEDRIVGIITFDDIMDVIEEENTEDIERMAGIMDSSDHEYLDLPVLGHVKSRLPWLFALMCSYMITGGIIQHFEGMLSQVISLVSYMPMLSGTGGNSGSQSATLVIRGLAMDELEPRDAAKVFWKELRVSMIIGISLSILNFLRVWLIDGNGFLVALTVSLSLALIVVIAKCAGGLLPIIAKKIGIDPALVASPVISSLTDMASVLIYFALATRILGLSS